MHIVRPYLTNHGPPQRPDHQPLMDMYGSPQAKPVVSTTAPGDDGSQPRTTRAREGVAINSKPGETGKAVGGSQLKLTPEGKAIGPMPSTVVVVDPPSSPSEIRVSTLRMISKKHGINAEQCAREAPSAPEAFEIVDQDWPVNAIVDCKTVGNERLLLVHWSDSYFHRRHILKRKEGHYYVRIDGEEWDVESFEEIYTDDEALRLCIIKWVPTWKPEEELDSAPDVIAAFDDRKQAREEDGWTIQSFQPVNRRSSFSGIGSHSVKQFDVSPEADPEHIEAEPHDILGLRFIPHPNEQYRGAAFREVLDRELGDSCTLLKLWRPEMDRRDLTFRPQYLVDGREYNLKRPDKRRAVYNYICGEEQEQQCEYCERGKGPFPKCVVAPNSINGACANCAISHNAKVCNYHHETETEHWDPHFEQQLLTPPPTSPLSESWTEIDEPEYARRTEASPELGSDTGFINPRRSATHGLESEQARMSNIQGQDKQHRAEVDGATIKPAQNASVEESSGTAYDRIKPLAENRCATTETLTPLAQTSKKRHLAEAESMLSVETDREENLPLRPAKIIRMANACLPAANSKTMFTFSKSAALAIWREDSFRHPGCSPDLEAACTDFSLHAQVDTHDHFVRRAAARIRSGWPFKSGKASDVEVALILRGCPCSFTQSFYESWIDWTHCTGVDCTQEEFLSHFYVDKLNEAMERFDLNRSTERSRQHRTIRMNNQDVIVIE